ncbi:CheR family methyltransferase [Granulicella paludicola]|uniref:CheR family methyltransferase n=1 Tax=Granulicella paludicola TaxID=474951 RepID=UPI0021DFF8A7|nr:protein-glutamate O-methyltransferase CheR [Granulicella paludicola]
MIAGKLTPPIRLEDFHFLTDYIRRESGINLDDEKQYLVEARLVPILQASHIESFDLLCAKLRSGNGGPLQQQIVEAMTTHETLFFRDSAPFDALKTHILPPLIEQRRSLKKLTFWSAAASSGQEAYSLAMLLLEMGLGDWNIKILGTDLSEKILDKAREGRYLQIEVNRGLPASYLVKYFERCGFDWQLRERVRKMVHFEKFDLRQSMRTKGPFDVIFCRNVLIYFDIETKKKILTELRGTLFSGGYLCLGGTESTLNLNDQFKRVAFGRPVFYQAP